VRSTVLKGEKVMDAIEQLARDLLARLSYDYGDSEDCPPEVQALFDRGERLLPVMAVDDVVARTRNTPPTPADTPPDRYAAARDEHQAECAAYSLLHRQAIREYQRAFHTDRDPGVCDAAQQMREEIERLRGALVRWHRANETRDFIAADDALAAIAAELASEA
jgi:hypothetical protein